jgi:chitinase
MSFAKKLNGKRPYGAYFQSWSSPWTSNAQTMDLANIKAPINVIFLSFVKPACSYTKGSMTFAGTGLDFSSDFAVVKAAIGILKSKGVIVMLSVGGATYHFDASFNPRAIIDFANDLGVDGIDIDWEPTGGASEAGALGGIINQFKTLYPSGLLSMAAFSVGAYGQGAFAKSQPTGQYTAMCIPGLVSNGHQLDFIALMTYDAGNSFDPTEAFKAYRSYYKGPMLIGAEIPPEAWGGHVITLDKVKAYANFVKTDPNTSNGLFVWSYQKAGQPTCNDIIATAASVLGAPTPVQPPTPQPTPPKPTPPAPTPVPAPTPAPVPVAVAPLNWNPLKSYNVGDIITYNNVNYTCVQAHSTLWKQSTTSPTPTPAPIQDTQNTWKPNTAYKVGDTVKYNNVNYRCLQAHTSIVSWEPVNTPALWQK